MKKKQREVYLVLAEVDDAPLCVWCKFDQSYCDTMECMHPLVDRLERQWHSYGIDLGDDCWGFRPWLNISLAADIVSVVLSNGFKQWIYYPANTDHPLPMIKGSIEEG